MMEARTRPFFSVFRAEVLKGRRGAPRKVALIAPLPFCALGVLSSGVISGTGATGGCRNVFVELLVRAHDARRHRAHLRLGGEHRRSAEAAFGAGAAVSPRVAHVVGEGVLRAGAGVRCEPRGAGLFDGAWSDGR